MIEVTVSYAAGGRLTAVRASGHSSGGAFGSNVVCAAVTALVRSAARALEQRSGLSVAGGARAPGELEFSIADGDSEDAAYLDGVRDVLVCGLLDVADEHPSECRVIFREETTGV